MPACKQEKIISHVFTPPVGMAEQWTKIMNTLRSDKKFDAKNKDHCVCSKHFEDKFLIKVDKYLINGVWVELPRDRWGITGNALPTMFPDLPPLLRPRTPMLRWPLVRVHHAEDKKKAAKLRIYKSENNLQKTKPRNTVDHQEDLNEQDLLHHWWKMKSQHYHDWIFKADENYSSIFCVSFERGVPVIERSIVVSKIYFTLTTELELILSSA